MPPPETVAEFATDIAGSITGSMASPESWIGFMPSAGANAVRMAAVDTAEAATRASGVLGIKRASQAFTKGVDDVVSDSAAGALGGETARTRELLDSAPNLEKKSLLQRAGDGLLDEATAKPIDLRAKLKEAKKKVYTLKEAYGL